MRALDLCCGAGGVSVGLARAGFDVVGVDIEPQPHYPFEFHQADALDYPLDGFDLICASPPCQAYSRLAAMHPGRAREYPRLIEPIRERLRESGTPYVIENVEGAPLIDPLVLCGSMFGLCVERGWLRRHRLFECSFRVPRLECSHPAGIRAVGVYGHGGHSGKHRMLYRAEAAEIMDINWMSRDEMAQAIPPAYSQYIGRVFVCYARGDQIQPPARAWRVVMPQARAASTTETSTAQGRFTVQLPAELKPALNRIADDMQRKVADVHGFAPEFSMADTIKSLVHGHERRRNGETPPPPPDDGGDGGDTGSESAHAGATPAKA